MLKFLDALSLQKILFAAVGWLLLFAAIYAVIPCYASTSAYLAGSPTCEMRSLPLAAYASVITMFSLGYSDIYPVGALRLFAAIEVIGGVVLSGLAIASIVAMPSNHTRQAIRACKGHWVECVDLPDGRRFFSFTSMFSDGRSLIKRGRNFHPGGPMHNTQYYGTLVTNLFPTLMSIYKNDQLSTDYTEGIFKFELEMSSNGMYRTYAGGCLDKMHGGRDRIFARRIEDSEFIQKYEEGGTTEHDLRQLVERLFGTYPGSPEPASPSISGTATTVITKISNLDASPSQM